MCLLPAMFATGKQNRNEICLQQKTKRGMKGKHLIVDLVTRLNLEIFHETNSVASCIFLMLIWTKHCKATGPKVTYIFASGVAAQIMDFFRRFMYIRYIYVHV